MEQKIPIHTEIYLNSECNTNIIWVYSVWKIYELRKELSYILGYTVQDPFFYNGIEISDDNTFHFYNITKNSVISNKNIKFTTKSSVKSYEDLLSTPQIEFKETIKIVKNDTILPPPIETRIPKSSPKNAEDLIFEYCTNHGGYIPKEMVWFIQANKFIPTRENTPGWYFEKGGPYYVPPPNER
jgi:hypothetical protein